MGKYYKVTRTVVLSIEHYVEANSKADAIERAEDYGQEHANNGVSSIERLPKAEIVQLEEVPDFIRDSEKVTTGFWEI